MADTQHPSGEPDARPELNGVEGLASRRSSSGRKGLIAGATVVAAALVAGGIWWAVGSNAAPAAAKINTDATVNVGLTLEPDNLDIRHTSGVALDQVLIDNVYEGLLKRNSDGTVSPSLATYERNADGTEYTFTLKQGVKFHDGKPLTIDDAVWSLQQVLDDSSITANKELTSEISSVEATGADTLKLTLPKPNANLLWSLSGRAGLVFEKAATNDLKTTANGTGPYKIDAGAWKQGDRITLTRNDDYWGDHAKVAAVNVIYQTDTNARLNALQSGSIDAGSVQADNVSKFQNDSQWQVLQQKSSSVGTLAFNSARGPLSDVRVRQALTAAIDKDAIKAALGGYNIVTGSPIAVGDPGAEDLSSKYPYDPDRAKQLLAEAGYGSGLDLTLTIPNIYQTQTSDVVAANLKAVGVNLKVNQVEFATWLQQVYKNHDYDLSFVLHAESRDFQNYANPKYYFQYDNAQVQSLYQQSVQSTDDQTQSDLLKQAAELVAADAPADWLYNVVFLDVVSSKLDGYPTGDTISRLNLTNLSVKAD